MAKREFSSMYKKGFREGFNNPKQARADIERFLNRNNRELSPKAKDYFDGKTSGIIVKERELQEGKSNRYIFSDKELNEVIE